MWLCGEQKPLSPETQGQKHFFLEMQNSLKCCHGTRRFYSGTNSLSFSKKKKIFFPDFMLIMSLLNVSQGLGYGFFLGLQWTASVQRSPLLSWKPNTPVSVSASEEWWKELATLISYYPLCIRFCFFFSLCIRFALWMAECFNKLISPTYLTNVKNRNCGSNSSKENRTRVVNLNISFLQ